MQPLEELEHLLEKARTAVVGAAEHTEHAPAVEAAESYARTTAMLFGQLLIDEIRTLLAQEPVPAPAAVTDLLEHAVAAAWQRLLQRSTAGVREPTSAAPAPPAAG